MDGTGEPPLDAHDLGCPVCDDPSTPHCTSPQCRWLTCVEPDCGTTWHPGRRHIILRNSH